MQNNTVETTPNISIVTETSEWERNGNIQLEQQPNPNRKIKTPNGYEFPARLLHTAQRVKIPKYEPQPFNPKDVKQVEPLFSDSKALKMVETWDRARTQPSSIGWSHKPELLNKDLSQKFLDEHSYRPFQWVADDGIHIRRPSREEANYKTGHLFYLGGGWGNPKAIRWNSMLLGNQGDDMEAEELRYAQTLAMRGVDYSNVAIPYQEGMAWLYWKSRQAEYRVVTERDYSAPYPAKGQGLSDAERMMARTPCYFYNPDNGHYEAYPETSVSTSAAQISQMIHEYMRDEEEALQEGGNAEVAMKYLFHSLLGGPPRSGKTTFAKALAAVLGVPFVKAAMTKHAGESLASDGLFGRTLMHGNSSEFVLTDVAYAYMYGGVVLMDEIANLTENAMGQLRSILSADETEIKLDGIPDYHYKGRVLVRHPAFYVVSTYNPGDTVEVPTDHHIPLLQDRCNASIPLMSHHYDLYDQLYSAKVLKEQIISGEATHDFAGTYACVIFAEFIDTLRDLHDPAQTAERGEVEMLFPQKPTFGHAYEFFHSENLMTALQVFPYFRELKNDPITYQKMITILGSSLDDSLGKLSKFLSSNFGSAGKKASSELDKELKQSNNPIISGSIIYDIMRKNMIGDTTQSIPSYLDLNTYRGNDGGWVSRLKKSSSVGDSDNEETETEDSNETSGSRFAFGRRKGS